MSEPTSSMFTFTTHPLERRDYLALCILQALIARPQIPDDAAALAVAFADDLMDALDAAEAAP